MIYLLTKAAYNRTVKHYLIFCLVAAVPAIASYVFSLIIVAFGFGLYDRDARQLTQTGSLAMLLVYGYLLNLVVFIVANVFINKIDPPCHHSYAYYEEQAKKEQETTEPAAVTGSPANEPAPVTANEKTVVSSDDHLNPYWFLLAFVPFLGALILITFFAFKAFHRERSREFFPTILWDWLIGAVIFAVLTVLAVYAFHMVPEDGSFPTAALVFIFVLGGYLYNVATFFLVYKLYPSYHFDEK
jgi:hypothetical protein